MISFIGTEFTKTVTDTYPWVQTSGVWYDAYVSRQEFEELKKEVQSLVKLLKAAKIYDEEMGQKDCEMEEKVALIKGLAEFLDVDLEDVFD